MSLITKKLLRGGFLKNGWALLAFWFNKVLNKINVLVFVRVYILLSLLVIAIPCSLYLDQELKSCFASQPSLQFNPSKGDVDNEIEKDFTESIKEVKISELALQPLMGWDANYIPYDIEISHNIFSDFTVSKDKEERLSSDRHFNASSNIVITTKTGLIVSIPYGTAQKLPLTVTKETFIDVFQSFKYRFQVIPKESIELPPDEWVRVEYSGYMSVCLIPNNFIFYTLLLFNFGIVLAIIKTEEWMRNFVVHGKT